MRAAYLDLEQEGAGPGGGTCDRPAADGHPQAPPVCCKVTCSHRFLPLPPNSHTLSAGGFLQSLSPAWAPWEVSQPEPTARTQPPVSAPAARGLVLTSDTGLLCSVSKQTSGVIHLPCGYLGTGVLSRWACETQSHVLLGRSPKGPFVGVGTQRRVLWSTADGHVSTAPRSHRAPLPRCPLLLDLAGRLLHHRLVPVSLWPGIL